MPMPMLGAQKEGGHEARPENEEEVPQKWSWTPPKISRSGPG